MGTDLTVVVEAGSRLTVPITVLPPLHSGRAAAVTARELYVGVVDNAGQSLAKYWPEAQDVSDGF